MNLFIPSITKFGILVIKVYVNPHEKRASSIKLLNFATMVSSEWKCWYEEKVDVTS